MQHNITCSTCGLPWCAVFHSFNSTWLMHWCRCLINQKTIGKPITRHVMLAWQKYRRRNKRNKIFNNRKRNRRRTIALWLGSQSWAVARNSAKQDAAGWRRHLEELNGAWRKGSVEAQEGLQDQGWWVLEMRPVFIPVGGMLGRSNTLFHSGNYGSPGNCRFHA